MDRPNYKREKCGECGQFKTYLLPIDRGTAMIVKSVAAAVKIKGINIIHPKKEMEVQGKEWSYERAVGEGKLTSTQIGNFTRARVHGLIARVKSSAGNWCLTTKGGMFLRGEPAARFAVIRKNQDGSGSHKSDYFEPEKYQITIGEVSKDGEFWRGIDFEIVEGHIVRNLPAQTDKKGLYG